MRVREVQEGSHLVNEAGQAHCRRQVLLGQGLGVAIESFGLCVADLTGVQGAARMTTATKTTISREGSRGCDSLPGVDPMKEMLTRLEAWEIDIPDGGRRLRLAIALVAFCSVPSAALNAAEAPKPRRRPPSYRKSPRKATMKQAALLWTVVWLALPLAVPAAEKPVVPARPNILLIVADDLGYGDVGCYGATKIKTPNIDRLAADGNRLTDAHSPAGVCQPTRYAILSGTYFIRAQRQGRQTLYFHEGQVTLPGLLKSAGYRTAAIGKWHLGFGRGAEPDYNAELKPGPLEIGFDSFFGCPRTHNEPPMVFVENHRMVGFDPADPIRILSHDEVVERGLKDWNWGLSEGAAKAHAARPLDRIDLILADKAVQFLQQQSDCPFFLYLAFLAPHSPIAPSREFQGTSEAARYGDFIQQLDACVGKVLETLQTRGMSDNTLVVFTSDNGAVLHRDALEAGHRANRSLLGQKTDAWEGGHRVPFIARWPGRIPAGSEGDQLLGLTDLMATLAAAAEVAVPEGAAPDSLNQLPVLTDPAHTSAVRTEFLMQGTGGFALRQDDWVYLPKQGSCGMTVQVPPGPPWGQPYAKLALVNSDIDDAGRVKPEAPAVQLYDLAADAGQTTNVAAGEPERVAAMQKRLDGLLARPKPAGK